MKYTLKLRGTLKFGFVLLILASGVFKMDAQIVNVWAVGDGEKVFRYDTDHVAEAGNSIWDGRRISLRGLYNEVLGFQVIVEVDSTGARGLELSMKPPFHQESGMVIGGSGAIRYGDQGYIEFFSQHYLQVKNPTQPNWFYGSENSAPAKMTGWIPDALIPSDALEGKGGFPLTIPPTKEQVYRHQNIVEIMPREASLNQGFWVDLYLPRDRNFPAGMYTSELQVWANGMIFSSIPVQIEIVNAYLPDENHSNVWVYSSGMDELGAYFPGLNSREIRQLIKGEAHRHRIELVGGFEAHQSVFDEAILEDYKPYLDGSAYTPAFGYHGPGEGMKEKLFPIGMYGSQVLGTTKKEIQAECDKWVLWFGKNAPGVNYFKYMIDEPGPSQYAFINEQAGWMKSNPGPGRKMKTQVTTGYVEDLKDAVDIWDAYDGVELGRMEELKKEGKDYWFYNGNRPRYGSMILEAAAVDLRVNGWIKYLYGINTWFVWHSTHWTHNSQGPKGRLQQRIFNEPLTFMNEHLEWGNGDGVIFYPGRMPYQVEEDRGLNRFMPSIRLKNIRRGQQDFELLWLAENKAGRDKIEALARELVVKAMDEVDMKDRVYWPQNGDAYDMMRDRLLDIIGGPE
ncbi:MAG: glycoside hydrolase domain-containing protein [Bacteroidota bacterium]